MAAVLRIAFSTASTRHLPDPIPANSGGRRPEGSMQYLEIGVRCLIGTVFLASCASELVRRTAHRDFVASIVGMRLLRPGHVRGGGRRRRLGRGGGLRPDGGSRPRVARDRFRSRRDAPARVLGGDPHGGAETGDRDLSLLRPLHGAPRRASRRPERGSRAVGRPRLRGDVPGRPHGGGRAGRRRFHGPRAGRGGTSGSGGSRIRASWTSSASRSRPAAARRVRWSTACWGSSGRS